MYTPLGLRLGHRGILVKGEGTPWPPSVLLNSSPVSSTSSSPAHTGGGPSSSSSSSVVVVHKPPNHSAAKDPSSSSQRQPRRRRRLLNDSTTSLIGEEEDSEEDSSEKGLIPRMSPELSMVLEKAVVLLTPDEFASLRLIISEYEDGTLPVREFASELLSLLRDEEKSSFFTELRELVRLPDLSEWDRCIYSRARLQHGDGRRIIHEAPSVGKKNKILFQPWENPRRYLFKPAESSRNDGSSGPLRFSPCHFGRNGDPYEEEDFLPRGESIYQNPPSSSFPSYLRYPSSSSSHRKRGVSKEISSSYSLQDRSHVDDEEGRRVEEDLISSTPFIHPSRHIAGPYDDLLDLEDCRIEVLRSPPCRNPASSSSYYNSSGDNQSRIRILKSSPTLGIAIEGGINTQQPLPRIIAIQPNGAAYRTRGIRVGQLIQEVNGISLSGLPHETVARIIAECYAKRNESFLTLLLKNQKLTPAEQRRSSSLHAHR